LEFNEKLQQLRKEKNLTQEALGQLLFVSRVTISKWESGRGYPSIDSLKGISQLFNISIDDLLSNEELIRFAEEDKKENMISLRYLLYGILALLLFIFKNGL
jgi:transcriptional regulator with XRE-family HTH domain